MVGSLQLLSCLVYTFSLILLYTFLASSILLRSNLCFDRQSEDYHQISQFIPLQIVISNFVVLDPFLKDPFIGKSKISLNAMLLAKSKQYADDYRV